MKKVILILMLISSILACKKKSTNPNDLITNQYFLNFLSFDLAIKDPKYHYYTDLQIIINNDTLKESLINHTSNRGYEQIEGEYIDKGVPAPTNGIKYPYPIKLNTEYTIKVIDFKTKTLLNATIGSFKIEENQSMHSRDITFKFLSEIENTNGINSTFPTWKYWNFEEGMGEGNVGNKYFFIPAIFHWK